MISTTARCILSELRGIWRTVTHHYSYVGENAWGMYISEIGKMGFHAGCTYFNYFVSSGNNLRVRSSVSLCLGNEWITQKARWAIRFHVSEWGKLFTGWRPCWIITLADRNATLWVVRIGEYDKRKRVDKIKWPFIIARIRRCLIICHIRLSRLNESGIGLNTVWPRIYLRCVTNFSQYFFRSMKNNIDLREIEFT